MYYSDLLRNKHEVKYSGCVLRVGRIRDRDTEIERQREREGSSECCELLLVEVDLNLMFWNWPEYLEGLVALQARYK